MLGVDSSLRGTGYSVLAGTNSGDVRCMEYGVIRLDKSLSVPLCLLEIHNELLRVIDRHHPEFMAIESTIYVQSYKTAIVLGAARGAALLSAATRGLQVCEFAPRKIKKAVVGRGGAAKSQVGFMIRALLHLPETPPPDAADAIAAALTFFQTLPFETRTSHL